MRNKKGYTLLELIITLAIVGIMILPIYNSFIESARTNVRSKRLVSAAYLAQNQMERIKGMTTSEFATAFDTPISGVTDGDLATYTSGGFNSSTITNYGGLEYTYTIEIDKLASDVVSTTPQINHVGNTRNSDVSINYLSSQNQGFSHGAVNLTFTDSGNPTATDDVPRLVFLDESGTIKAKLFTGDRDSPVEIGEVSISGTGDMLVNVSGFMGQTLSHRLEVQNQVTTRVVDVKIYNDENDLITVMPTSDSRGTIRIGNALPTTVDNSSTLEYWFKVTVTVVHNNTVYEVLQTTVGK